MTITSGIPGPEQSSIDREFLKTIATELADLGPVPSHAELRAMLSHDKSSWSDAVIAERQQR